MKSIYPPLFRAGNTSKFKKKLLICKYANIISDFLDGLCLTSKNSQHKKQETLLFNRFYALYLC